MDEEIKFDSVDLKDAIKRIDELIRYIDLFVSDPENKKFLTEKLEKIKKLFGKK